jgi:hypothetical protein
MSFKRGFLEACSDLAAARPPPRLRRRSLRDRDTLVVRKFDRPVRSMKKLIDAKRARYTDRGASDATARGHTLRKDISQRHFQRPERSVRGVSRATHHHKVRISWMATVQPGGAFVTSFLIRSRPPVVCYLTQTFHRRAGRNENSGLSGSKTPQRAKDFCGGFRNFRGY